MLRAVVRRRIRVMADSCARFARHERAKAAREVVQLEAARRMARAATAQQVCARMRGAASDVHTQGGGGALEGVMSVQHAGAGCVAKQSRRHGYRDGVRPQGGGSGAPAAAGTDPKRNAYNSRAKAGVLLVVATRY